MGTLFLIKKSSNFDFVRFASCRKSPLIISLETKETINVKKITINKRNPMLIIAAEESEKPF